MPMGEAVHGEADDQFGGGTDHAVGMTANGFVMASSSIVSDVPEEDAGSVRLFHYDGTNWVQMGPPLLGNVEDDRFGSNVLLSADGDRMVAFAHLLPSVPALGSISPGRQNDLVVGPTLFDKRQTTVVAFGVRNGLVGKTVVRVIALPFLVVKPTDKSRPVVRQGRDALQPTPAMVQRINSDAPIEPDARAKPSKDGWSPHKIGQCVAVNNTVAVAVCVVADQARGVVGAEDSERVEG